MPNVSGNGDGLAIQPGSRLDHFEVQRLLGPRSIGVAYRGYDWSAGRDVAILVLDPLASPEARQHFESEARKLVALRHPHLLAVIAFGERRDLPYLISDYVEGSLADLIEGRRLESAEALRILRGVAVAMDDAHRARVLHGHLKPSGILMGPDGGPLVSGFGLLSLRTDGTVDDRSAAGAFTAPEQQIHGELTAAADRYSVAAIAHLLLTGSMPAFDPPGGSDKVATPRLRKSAEIGPKTYEVLRRGLAYWPDDRWSSCTAMVDALRDAASSDAAPAVEAPGRGALRYVTVAAIVIIALVAILGVVSRLRSEPAPTPGITISDTSVQQGGSLIVNGSGLPPNQAGTVELESAGEQVGTFQADQNGNTTTRVTIPESVAPGSHLVSLCWGECHASARLTVTERAATPTPASSPTPSPSPTPSVPPSPTPTANATPSSKPSPASASPSPSQ